MRLDSLSTLFPKLTFFAQIRGGRASRQHRAAGRTHCRRRRPALSPHLRAYQQVITCWSNATVIGGGLVRFMARCAPAWQKPWQNRPVAVVVVGRGFYHDHHCRYKSSSSTAITTTEARRTRRGRRQGRGGGAAAGAPRRRRRLPWLWTLPSPRRWQAARVTARPPR